MRELRERIGMTAAEAAARIGVSPSKISRLENGLRGPKVPDVAALLRLYRAPETRMSEVLELARKAARIVATPQPGWRLPKGLRALVNQEREALGFRIFDATAVPALLQTSGYARAVFGCSATIPTREVDDWVAIRLARQAILTRSRPPTLSVIIAEQVLRTPVGGPAVFAEQLGVLLARAAHPDIQVRVLPDTAAGSGSFTILDFPGAGPAVHLNTELADRTVDDPDQVSAYQRVFTRLGEEAIDPARSMGFIAARGREFGGG